MRNYEPERNVVIHNPHSTRHALVERRVLERLDDMCIEYESFVTRSPKAEDNIADIAEFVRPGDVVYAAAGDGTSHQVGSGILQSGHAGDIILGFGPYGNFNDGAHALGNVDPAELFNGLSATRTIRPIEIMINDREPRTALFYATFGLIAIISHEFMTNNREALKNADFKLLRSLQSVGEMYLKNQLYTLPKYIDLEGKRHKRDSDIILRNSPRMGALVGGKDYLSEPVFGKSHLNLGMWLLSSPFIVRSMRGHMPNDDTDHLEAAFSLPSDTWAMIDGESEPIRGVRSISAKKRTDGPQLTVAHVL